MEQKKEMTIEDLQAENISLRKENNRLNQARAGLITKNQELAEFIRTQLDDILVIAKKFRDEYKNYADFVSQVSRLEASAIGELPDDSNSTTESNI